MAVSKNILGMNARNFLFVRKYNSNESKRIADDKLEMKNAELKHKIEDYKQGPEQKWELFKIDFNKDVDDLGKSISNMAERNMKK